MLGNWLDIVLLIVLAVSFVLGVLRGFIRQVVGLAAVVAGFFIAAYYHPYLADVFGRAFASGRWSNLIAFLLIFFGVLALGSLVGFLLSKLMRGPLRLIDRVFGGALGLVKGILISGVIVMALLAFPTDTRALTNSTLAPYCYWLTKGMVQLVPQELKDAFNETYQNIVGSEKEHGQKI
jgi:membrane protein required for colicin V production